MTRAALLVLAMAAIGCVDAPEPAFTVNMTEDRASVWLYFTCFVDCNVEVSASGSSRDMAGKASLEEVVDVYLHEEVRFGGGLNFYKQVEAGTAPEEGQLSLHATSDDGTTFFIELNRPSEHGWSSATVNLHTDPVVEIFETIGPDRNAM